MREILFRGKRTDNGEWVQGYLFKIWDKAYILWGTTNDIPNMIEVIPETVGQYTGLTDKNGKMIFEGDIIRYADECEYNCYLESLEHPEGYREDAFDDMWTIDEVVYCIKTNYPAFDLRRHNWDVNGLSELKESCAYYYEIIGNIHDNPELLKEGAE